jgi:hypothetical protein
MENVRAMFFASVLPESHQNELETLMFFNTQQNKFVAGIVQSVETYGCPRIVTEGQQLRVMVGDLGIVQSLFAFDSDRPDATLIGVILYFRECIEQLTVLHIAIQADYSGTGAKAHQLLAVRLIQQVRIVAAHLKGITTVALLYGDTRLQKIPVYHTARQKVLSY